MRLKNRCLTPAEAESELARDVTKSYLSRFYKRHFEDMGKELDRGNAEICVGIVRVSTNES